ncbi:MAG: hypothetical protein E7294_12350 [Lachnospiraceae bacterium]|jgi:hypothetical protein|nr:hypothetical protein [Lachnospiraceae bacterium]
MNKEETGRFYMEQLQQMAWIAGVFGLILMILFLKEKLSFFIRLAGRGILCTALLWGMDQALFFFGIQAVPGINPWTVLTGTILGFPGLCLLFGVCYF